jgi:hypothetical protein
MVTSKRYLSRILRRAPLFAVLSAGGCKGDSLVLQVGPIIRVQAMDLATGTNASTIKAGGTGRVVLLGYDANNEKADLTPDAWTVRNTAVATNAGATITGVGTGQTYAIASLATNGQVFVDSVRIVVTP